MSDQQLTAFLENVKSDASLQERLKTAGDAEVIVAIAKAEGFTLSVEELKRSQVEISDSELESVAAGAIWDCSNGPLYTWNKGAVGCG